MTNAFKPTGEVGLAPPCSPIVHGEVPSFRFRHVAALARPDPGSLLHQRVSAALAASHASLASSTGQPAAEVHGNLLLLYAGYDTRGSEYGGHDVEVRRSCIYLVSGCYSSGMAVARCFCCKVV